MRNLFANDLKQVYQDAKEAARRHLRERKVATASALLEACSIKEGANQGALVVLRELAAVIDVDPGQFRPDDRLRELFSFEPNVLGAHAATVLEKYGLKEIEVFGEDILWSLTRVAESELWESFWKSLPYRPHSDDDWIDVLMGLTVCELINTFGAVVALS
jgi:hypothetical protein